MGFLKTFSLLNVNFISKRLCSKAPENKMARYLNVAEKNDAAKTISSILSRGASTRREGFSQYNKIYEFDAQVFGQNVHMVMTSVSGHLLNYAFAANFKNWQTVNPVALFEAPVSKVCPENYQNIKRTLEREIRSCAGLVVWTDCDREGENIGYEVIQVCTDVKPNLIIYRAKFSEMTGTSIFRALATLGQPNKNVSDAVDVRQELDLRTGAAFTRLQTLHLQKAFPTKLSDKLISYGSCQFPTLGFVVDRYQSIENFISENFWRIKMNHKQKNLTTDFNWQRDRLFDKNAVEAILDICQESNLATVESVDNRSKSKWRPLPLDTVEFEKSVSRKLKINAKDAMKIAEKLYTQGFISYPRTETNIFPKELNLRPLVEAQFGDNRWGEFAQRIMNDRGPNPRVGKKTDQAHPPIHPTKTAPNLAGNEARIYEFIVRHFLACVHKDAQGHETSVNVDIADEKFNAKGLVILEKNYLDVYVYEKWTGKEIIEYQPGDTFTPSTLELAESSTAPPKLLTEADLIALMDKHGIGTDATHAEHIDTIKSREYVGLHENIYFVPGTLGMGLVEGYNNIGLEVSLAKPLLRAEFENDLKLICEGRKNAEEVRRIQIAKYKSMFQKVVDKLRELDNSLSARLDQRAEQVNLDNLGGENNHRSPFKCPKCGSPMTVMSRKNGPGKFLSCSNYPTCRNSVWFPSSVENVEVLDQNCRECGPDVKKLKIKFKQNPFIGEPNPNILCIGGCDRNVLETLDINLSSVRQTNANPNATINNLNRTNAFPNTQPPATRAPQNTQPPARAPVNRTPNNNTQNNARNNWTPQNNPVTVPGLGVMPGPQNAGPPNRNNLQNPPVNFGGDSNIVCACDQEAMLLTVRKDGPNKGKQFYKCQSGACNFFLWAPEDNDHAANNTQGPPVGGPAPGGAINCNCNTPAVLRTVQKEGNNKGRQFYCCPKPQNEGCKFFKWADEVNNDNNGGGGGDDWGGGGGGGPGWNMGAVAPPRNNYRGRGGGQNRNNRAAPYKNQTRAKRKCTGCGQEGHTRPKCPNN